jgi:hypothetical protein
MFDLSMMIALQRSQDRILEELYGVHRPSVALEVRGTTPTHARRAPDDGLRLTRAWTRRKFPT